jgi:hypothetical protein
LRGHAKTQAAHHLAYLSDPDDRRRLRLDIEMLDRLFALPALAWPSRITPAARKERHPGAVGAVNVGNWTVADNMPTDGSDSTLTSC